LCGRSDLVAIGQAGAGVAVDGDRVLLQLLLEVTGDLRELLVDIPDDFALSGRLEGAATR
jgi:hypothetical protein